MNRVKYLKPDGTGIVVTFRNKKRPEFIADTFGARDLFIRFPKKATLAQCDAIAERKGLVRASK